MQLAIDLGGREYRNAKRDEYKIDRTLDARPVLKVWDGSRWSTLATAVLVDGEWGVRNRHGTTWTGAATEDETIAYMWEWRGLEGTRPPTWEGGR